MKVEKFVFAETPEKIVLERFDCIWISFEPREIPDVLRSSALQWLDWKLQGQISRFLLAEGNESTTVVPTMRKIPTPYLVLEKGSSTNWTVFARNCEGMKLSRVLYFCEQRTKVTEVKTEVENAVRENGFSRYPESIMLGSDS